MVTCKIWHKMCHTRYANHVDTTIYSSNKYVTTLRHYKANAVDYIKCSNLTKSMFNNNVLFIWWILCLSFVKLKLNIAELILLFIRVPFEIPIVFVNNFHAFIKINFIWNAMKDNIFIVFYITGKIRFCFLIVYSLKNYLRLHVYT